MSYNGLIVMEEAASQRHQSHREDRQDGDRTHYKTPRYAKLCLAKKKHVPGPDWLAKLQQQKNDFGKFPASSR